MAARRLALAGLALLLTACDPPRVAEPYKTVPITPFLGSPVLGDKAAPVELVEYASTTCSHCLAFHRTVFPELKAKYIDPGKVKLRWVVLPTPPAAISVAGGQLAYCAGEEKFFAVIADLFEAQENLLTVANQPWQVQKQFRDIGARHGLSSDQVGTCLDDKTILKTMDDAMAAMPPTISTTPSFSIDGQKIEKPALDTISAALDAALAKAAPPT